MENYLIYIGKAALAAGAFYLVYLVLFQNQKQFVFNRIYLPVSLALSFIIPLITFTTVQYIEAPATDASSFAYLGSSPATTTVYSESPTIWPDYLFGLYLLGISGFLFHLLAGHFNAIRMIRKSHAKNLFGNRVHITKKDVHPFSFFNKIVLSEKTLESPNLKMIVAHENIHVKEKHTLDILFAEVLFLVQWFNPFAWLLKDAVKNNLEYKTDHEIVKNTDPQTYQLAMVALADKKGVAPFLTALNGSQLKNRIIMMKKKTENKFAPLKQFIVLPLLAVLVMGLSNKEIKTEIIQRQTSEITSLSSDKNSLTSTLSPINDNTESDSKTEIENFLISIEFKENKFILHGLKGCAFKELTFSENTRMPVTINEFGMTSSTTSNTNENSNFLFSIEKTDDLIKLTGKTGTAWKELTFSPASKKHLINESGVSQANKPQTIKNETKTDSKENKSGLVPSSIKIDTSNEPLYVIDGEIAENINQIPLENIESIDVLKDISATALYGSKGKNGVIIIKTKSGKDSNSGYSARVHLDTKTQDQQDIEVDEMPQFPGGEIGLNEFIKSRIVYPERALDNGIIGTVYVEFIISKSGKVKDAKIAHGVDPDLNKEALRVVNTMPPWRPGRKDGKLVDVSYTVPVEFDFKGFPHKIKSAAGGLTISNPLYVIDGIEYEEMPENIDPDNIKSIDVLKGESGTKHFGEKGKDGVIIIHTKDSAEKSLQGRIDNSKIESSDDLERMSLKSPEGETPPLFIVDGKEVETINEISPKDVERVEVLKDKSATDLYGEKGKNGVIIITTKKYAAQNKITTELELRKFIARNIKYPIEAQEAGIHGLVATSIKIGKKPEIISFGQYKNENSFELDEVVVVAYSKENTTPNPEKDSPILFEEVERVLQMLPEIDIPKFEGKNIGVRVKFELQ